MTTLTAPAGEDQANFQAWRSIALERMPYMASMLFALRVVNTPGLGTFAVDANFRLYIDFDAVTPLGPIGCAEALLHECSHLLADHHTSAAELGVTAQTAQDWNAAADASINDDLLAVGCDSLRDGVLPAHLGEPDFQTPHHYFAAIVKLRQQQQASQPQPNPSGDPGQHGQPQSGQSGETGEGDTPGNSGPYTGCGSGAGGQAAPCELGDDDDLGGQAPAAGTGEKQRVRVATATAIREHAKGRGTLPGGLVEIADQVLAPSKTPWQQVLAAHIRRAVAAKAGPFDVDRTRRHRRRHRTEVTDRATGQVRGRLVVPGTYTPVPTIEVIRDTSGSMSESDLAVVMREVEAIARRLGVRGDQLLVTDVDATVHSTRTFTGRASVVEAHGRGGTDMSVGIEHAWARRRNRATVIVVITDGETPWPTARGPIPVVAALVGTTAHTDRVLSGPWAPPDWVRTVVLDPAA